MADVQLEHGHLRIANALEEAIIYASFTGTQMKIVRCIVRLTYGWRQRTVRISMKDLAERCNVAFTGGFRRALGELIRQGVVSEVDESHGRTPALYSINKDFENWGRLSVPARTLEALYSERPWGADSLLDKATPQGPTNEGRPHAMVPPQGTDGAPIGTPEVPHRGMVEGSKSLQPDQMEGRKDSSTVERHTTTTAVRRDPITDYATGLSTAANGAITQRWREQPNPIHYRTGIELAAELISLDVPLKVARDAIATAIAKSKKSPTDGLPTTLAYWRNSILEAHRIEEQRELNAADAGNRRGGTPTPIAETVDPDRARQEKAARERLKDDHNAARRSAVEAWARGHAGEYAAVVADVDSEWGGFGDSSWAKRGRDAEIIVRCAAKAGFEADVDVWAEKRLLDKVPQEGQAAAS